MEKNLPHFKKKMKIFIFLKPNTHGGGGFSSPPPPPPPFTCVCVQHERV